MRILKVTKQILEHNKMENKNNWTTFCSPFAVPSGNKTFLTFRKGRWKIQLLKVSKPFLEHNKMESKNNWNWTTFGSVFTVPSGGKYNSKISKRWISNPKLKVSNTPSKTEQFFNKTLVKTIGPH